jgi:flagellar basal body P-ring protein FlgI
MLSGCSYWSGLSGNAKPPKDADPTTESHVRLVGDVADSAGVYPVKIEAVGLVSGLNGTGSDPEPSNYRSMLLTDMQRRGVPNPNAVLASRNTALVLVRGILRPGIQKGDPFDVEVRIPGRSETISLRGGYLLETRLTDMAVLDDGRLHDGRPRGLAKGPVLVDPSASDKNNKVLLGRGRVLRGGVALESRSLGLILKSGHQSVRTSAQVAESVNRRFHLFQRGLQVGVAKAKTHEYVELIIHPRYKENIERYMHVLRAVAIQESASETSQRIAELAKKLREPSTAASAAVQLEAIGTPGIDALLTGIAQQNPEVRFYAAEALAYLDRREAAEPLADAARHEPAFRVFALTALSIMSDFAAYEQLRDLLAVPSAETRYGAFRAMCALNPDDALVKGENLGGFSYHVLDTPGAAMVHVTRNRRAEIVLFGQQQRLLTPLAVNAGPIMVTSTGPEEISVSKFTTGEPDQKRAVSTKVDDVIRAIVELGGAYPDVVQALQEAKAAGALEARFEVEALPEAGRTYDRTAHHEGDGDSSIGLTEGEKSTASGGESKDDAAADKPAQPAKGFFARMFGE